MQFVNVTWNNVQATSSAAAPKGTLKVERINCATNGGDPPSHSLTNIIIKTLNNVTPGSISGPVAVNRGVTNNLSYSIQRVAFPNTGVQGGHPSTLYADSYQWIIPSGWKIGTTTSNGTTPITGQSHSVTVTPHSCDGNGGKIRVRAFSNCGSGYTSNWSNEITISRPLPTLTFNQAPPSSITCGVTTPITISVAAVPGATSYSWTKPNGWGGSSTSNTITLTPNGTNGGNVTVTANLCGTQTSTLSTAININIFNPSNPPTISGANLLCVSNSSYSLQNLPAGATATWAVTPTGLFGGSLSGSGTTASIRALNNFSTSGQGKITFTIQTSCGSFEVERQMWVGVPNSDQISITPNYLPICLNEPTYLNAYYNGAMPGNMESNITYYEWIPPFSGCYSTGNKNQVLICNFQQDGYHTLRARAQNACGISGWHWIYPYVYGCYYYAVSINPNPADDFINIELEEVPLETSDKGWENPIDKLTTKNSEFTFNKLDYEIKIYDQVGNLVKSVKSDQMKQAVDVSSLKAGRYFVHIEHPDGVIKRQILVE
ncbi:T9SS type A sorting domain-containing protein [Lunatimonas salinarum]|uniref:T9SS type A sorting domain-containing protein n=1 Tax=Lunatimonas salinarum TaxID=1774590 RepID=UPI001ADF1D09|nr:T9SS type A sorting domain-containing protein [Lunatimonas salinarum]